MLAGICIVTVPRDKHIWICNQEQKLREQRETKAWYRESDWGRENTAAFPYCCLMLAHREEKQGQEVDREWSCCRWKLVKLGFCFSFICEEILVWTQICVTMKRKTNKRRRCGWKKCVKIYSYTSNPAHAARSTINPTTVHVAPVLHDNAIQYVMPSCQVPWVLHCRKSVKRLSTLKYNENGSKRNSSEQEVIIEQRCLQREYSLKDRSHNDCIFFIWEIIDLREGIQTNQDSFPLLSAGASRLWELCIVLSHTNMKDRSRSFCAVLPMP